MIKKAELRKQIQLKRDALTKDEVQDLSAIIANRIRECDAYQSHNHICIYQEFRNEVSCDLIKHFALEDHKHVYVPITNLNNNTIEFYEITNETKWHKGAYGILEPEINSSSLTLTNKALIIMPGLVFDKWKHRIGYGGGYYDRYLELHKEHTTVAICYDFQICNEELPYELHDILPDMIISENMVI